MSTTKVCTGCKRAYPETVTWCDDCELALVDAEQSAEETSKRRKTQRVIGAAFMVLALALYFVRPLADTMGGSEVAAAQIRVFVGIPLFVVGSALWKMGRERPKQKRKR